MASLRAQWVDLSLRFAALGRRERLLVLAAVVVGGLMLGYTLLIEPRLLKARKLQGAVVQQQADLGQTQAQILGLQQQLAQDPGQLARSELATLRDDLEALNRRLREMESTLVSPEKMTGMLETILTRQTDLRLLSLKTLPVASIIERPASETAGAQPESAQAPGSPPVAQAAADTPAQNIYKHGVEIRIEGSYGSLMNYLSVLEREQKKLLWGDLRFEVEQYPRAVLIMVVYTLSVDKAWLSV